MADRAELFPAEALAKNRSGHLTGDQARRFQRMVSGRRKSTRGLAVPVGAIGALLLVLNGPAATAGDAVAFFADWPSRSGRGRRQAVSDGERARRPDRAVHCAADVEFRSCPAVGAHLGADDGFRVVPRAAHRSRSVVLATGGQSLPKTGSDGAGFTLARSPGTPSCRHRRSCCCSTARVPHRSRELSGVSHGRSWLSGLTAGSRRG
jgi:hypothetical protein